MKIKFKKINNRYAFDIIDNDAKVIYASDVHYFTTPHVQQNYKYAWEACRDSHKLLFSRPHHLFANRDDMTDPVITDISTNQMLANHYMSVYEGLKEQAQGLDNDPKERDFTYKSIKIVEGELNKILETLTDDKGKRPIRIILSRVKKLLRKYFIQEERRSVEKDVSIAVKDVGFKKIGSVDVEVRKGLIEEYAQKICQAVQDKHPDCYYAVASDKIKIMDEKNTCILEASVNGDLNIENIIPCGKLRALYSFHSDCFYQKYWKPIVEAIGYFVIGSPKILVIANVTTLPDVPKGRDEYYMDGWNIEDKKEQPLRINFSKGLWSINQAQHKTASSNISQHIDQDYLNAIVKCNDTKLGSIYNRSGAVVQVIPHTDIVEIDVDFGRGIGIVRLTEKQVEIISV